MEKPQLKRAVLRGGAVRVVTQATNVFVRIGALMVFARLLSPTDFGLIGMVVAVTAVLGLLKDFGLSTATVQRPSVTEAELSGLFWLNILFGVILWLLCISAAPLIAWFYDEGRLFWITVALSAGFFFTAAGVQHNALLQRRMHFITLASIEILALLSSTGIGLTMAWLGFGYWALVAWSVALPIVTCAGVWIAARWVPQMPRRGTSVWPLVQFGGLVTLNTLVVQLAYNLDKVLVGRVWGATVLGQYGLAYQMTSIVSGNLAASIGAVAFPALSRIQADAQLESYFLKGYKLVLTMAFPVASCFILFSEDIVAVFLGAEWAEVAPLLRILGPLIAIFALIDPPGWLLFSLGRVDRSLKIALAILPIVALGYIIGLPYGAIGVAAGFTIAMALWMFPHLMWCTRETRLSAIRMLSVARIPTIACLVAAPVAYGIHVASAGVAPLLRLLAEGLAFALTYVVALLSIKEERTFYLSLLRSLSSRGESESPRPRAA